MRKAKANSEGQRSYWGAARNPTSNGTRGDDRRYEADMVAM